jgi:hypothetical protein
MLHRRGRSAKKDSLIESAQSLRQRPDGHLRILAKAATFKAVDQPIEIVQQISVGEWMRWP